MIEEVLKMKNEGRCQRGEVESGGLKVEAMAQVVRYKRDSRQESIITGILRPEFIISTHINGFCKSYLVFYQAAFPVSSCLHTVIATNLLGLMHWLK